MTEFVSKRIYDSAKASDSYRVLVDRLWPRGVSKQKAKLDEWCKDIAPSDELRQWFDHDPAKYTEFKKRYRRELAANPRFETIVNQWKQHDKVTLLYGARDEEHNQATALLEYLD